MEDKIFVIDHRDDPSSPWERLPIENKMREEAIATFDEGGWGLFCTFEELERENLVRCILDDDPNESPTHLDRTSGKGFPENT